MAKMDINTDDIKSSLNFSNDLRQLKTASEISEGVDKALVSARKKFSSVAAAKASNDVEIGEVIDTVSYYDGWGAESSAPLGGNTYIKVGGQTPNEDGGSIIYTDDGNHLRGLFPNGDVFIEQFGAKSGSNSADAVEKAAAFKRSGQLRCGAGNYYIERTVQFPAGVGIRGNTAIDINDSSTTFSGVDGGTYVNDYLFFLNVDVNDPSTWAQPYPNLLTVIEDLEIDNTYSNDGLNSFYFCGNYEFNRIRNTNVATLISRPNIYNDSVKITQIHSKQRANSNDYLIYLHGLGDALHIDTVAAGNNPSNSYKSIYVSNCRGGSVSNLINGYSEFVLCQAFEVSGCHLESGSMLFDRCDAHVHDNLLYRTEYGDGQIIFDGGSTQGTYSVSNNNVFQLIQGWNDADLPESVTADIVVTGRASINTSNNLRSATVQGVLGKKITTAAIIQYGGTIDNTYNKYRAYLCGNPTVIGSNNANIDASFTCPKVLANNGSISNIIIESVNNLEFTDSITTYYYAAQIIVDSDRLIAADLGSENSVTITSTNDIPFLYIATGADTASGFILRLYRGTSSGVYDKYVDLHMMSNSPIFDTGEYVANIPWSSRSAGGVDDVNGTGFFERISIYNNIVELATVGGTPSLGEWEKGDILNQVDFNSNEGEYNAVKRRRLTSGSNWVRNSDYVQYLSFSSSSTYKPMRRVPLPPLTSTSSGSQGDFASDGTYVYFCVSSNNWVRVSAEYTF